MVGITSWFPPRRRCEKEKEKEKMNMLRITVCPSCGGTKIKKVRRNASGEFEGRQYTVPSLKFYECPDCGEKVYDRDAMQRIEEHSPAFDGERASS